MLPGTCSRLCVGVSCGSVSLQARLSLAFAASLIGSCPALTAQFEVGANLLLLQSLFGMDQAQHIASAAILSCNTDDVHISTCRSEVVNKSGDGGLF